MLLFVYPVTRWNSQLQVKYLKVELTKTDAKVWDKAVSFLIPMKNLGPFIFITWKLSCY